MMQKFVGRNRAKATVIFVGLHNCVLTVDLVNFFLSLSTKISHKYF